MAAHFQLILRDYDLPYRQAVLRFQTNPHRAPPSSRRTGSESETLRSHSQMEHIMFANLAQRFNTLFVNTEEHERDTYLASSADLVDLEHRLHVVETSHHPFTLYSPSAPHKWKM